MVHSILDGNNFYSNIVFYIDKDTFTINKGIYIVFVLTAGFFVVFVLRSGVLIVLVFNGGFSVTLHDQLCVWYGMAMSLVRTSLCKPSLPGSLLNKEGCRGGSPRAWFGMTVVVGSSNNGFFIVFVLYAGVFVVFVLDIGFPMDSILGRGVLMVFVLNGGFSVGFVFVVDEISASTPAGF